MNTQAIGATETTLQSAVADLDTLQALRRIVVLLESQACVDSAGRQRIAVDNATSASPLFTTLSGTNTVNSITQLFGLDQRQLADAAQTCFANTVRRQLN